MIVKMDRHTQTSRYTREKIREIEIKKIWAILWFTEVSSI